MRPKDYLQLGLFFLVSNTLLISCMSSGGSSGKEITASIETVTVEGGTFLMGSPEGEGDASEHPQHEVTLSTFKISKYEITNAQYADFMNAIKANADGSVNGTEYLDMDDKGCQITYENHEFAPLKGKEDYPAVTITWFGAVAYAKWAGGRLPTEAEWEYAARGGNKSKGYIYSGSNTIDEVAWYEDNSGNTSHPVGTKAPNELGIYDMSGNVYEWCSDWYSTTYPNTAQTDPKGPSSNSEGYRVSRGGSYYEGDNAFRCRIAKRYRGLPNSSISTGGFRIVFD